jgi:hypothetical protein
VQTIAPEYTFGKRAGSRHIATVSAKLKVSYLAKKHGGVRPPLLPDAR